ncbi:MAG TPA: FAD-binding oxidoreductase [Planctomycetaceae bacterium]|nr:FAD-binding oxidoreductase [Planctomycetaceae bacterium]
MVLTEAGLNDLARVLRERIAGEVRFDEMTRGLYSTDASIYQISPVGVVFPRNRDDVIAAVDTARERGIPVLPRGSGTSLSGQTVASALVLDFSRFMNRVLEIDPQRRLVRIEPGVVLDQLNTALKPHGLQFGPDVATSSRANLGGMIGNNSAGSRSVRQGKVIDHVRELEIVLSDGTSLNCKPVSAESLQKSLSHPGREGEVFRGLSDIVARNRKEILAKYPRILRRVSGYNLDAFLPELYRQMPQPAVVRDLDREWPDRADFNLARIFVGAEGTLGAVTGALLHAVPLPRERGVVLLEFRTIDAALEATPRILECEPSAVELLDRNIVELSRQNLKYRKSLEFVSGTPEALLIVEFSADSEVVVRDSLQLLEQKLKGWPGLDRFLPATSAEQREQIWNCRKAGAPLLLSIPGARKPIAFVEDTAVDPSRLAAFTRRFRSILSKHGITGAYYGHASVGCLHIRPMVDTKTAGDLSILKAVSDEVAELVHEFGGAMTGEHGDGLARSYHNLRLFGPQLFEAFQQVKRLMDPLNLMNPGKVTETPSPTENLRYGVNYPGAHVETFQDFTREASFAGAPGQGFLAAAEACNGSAVCRKTATGTMCPSFMVTLDEEQSTRGRANALRLALTGQLEPGALTSQRMWDVMENCLMCKGCKAECPSNVDVAKLKVEFLGHYYTAHTPSLGTRMLANTGWINRIGSALAPISNWLGLVGGGLREWLTGIDRRRPLPRFVRQNFARWFDRHQPANGAGTRGRVVLLDDCLTSYCEPGVNRSAVELLEAAGYQVERANLWCCGRPFISKGLLDQAKSLVRRNVAILDEYARENIPILGVEPSCLLTLVDEYPDLFPSEATQRVRQQAQLLDGWLASRVKSGEARLEFQSREGQVLLHGHCQQKALVGTGGTRQALGLIPGLSVKEVDSGCCGMAGSFGYEHYDVSQQIGERVLFPAVRAHASQTGTGPVCAPGFSCRHQVLDGTGQRPLHPVELLREQLVKPEDH